MVQFARRSVPEEAMAPAHSQARAVCCSRRVPGLFPTPIFGFFDAYASVCGCVTVSSGILSFGRDLGIVKSLVCGLKCSLGFAELGFFWEQ